MKCPRRKRYASNDHGGWDEEFLGCSKEECAWWSEEAEQCDPLGIITWLMLIEGHISRLVDKMPPGTASKFG